MTIQEQTADLHLTASQVLALMDAITEAVGGQVEALAGSADAKQNGSNAYMANELHARLQRATQYTRTVVRQTILRLEALGMEGSEPLPPFSLTPYGLLERTTGYVSYRDAAASQNIPADTATAVANARSVVDETQKPADVETFYDGNRFRAHLGDALLYRITFDVTPTDDRNTATQVAVFLDYGAPGAKLFYQVKPIGLGYDQKEPITYLVLIYAGATFAAQGARLMVESDGPLLLENVSYFVSRIHRSA